MAGRATRRPLQPIAAETGGWTALTPERQEKIAGAIRKGVFPAVSAVVAGVSKPTFRRWMALGADRTETDEKGAESLILGAEPYRAFRAAIEKAEADLEADLTERYRTVSRQAAFGNANYLGKFMSQRLPQNWRDTQAVELSGPSGGPIEVQGDDESFVRRLIDAAARIGVDRLGPASAGPDAAADELHPEGGGSSA